LGADRLPVTTSDLTAQLLDEITDALPRPSTR
jgi:hypothetical protein